MDNKCLILSGISGAGKTTVGKKLSQQSGWHFVDGDDFFLENKPKYTLSDGSVCTNWDCPQAIDWTKLNTHICSLLTYTSVILVTFLPLINYFKFPIHNHIMLNTGTYPEIVIERAIENRIISKRLTDAVKIRKDRLIVRELVYPQYLDIAKDNCIIYDVYNSDGNRKTIDAIVKELILICG